MLRAAPPGHRRGHLLNPDWPGHARLHLMWLLVFMLLSGLVIVHQLWIARPLDARRLWLVAAWQLCLIGGYWGSVLTAPLYGGVLSVPGEHSQILGVEESVFAFSWFSLFWALGLASLLRASGADGARAR